MICLEFRCVKSDPQPNCPQPRLFSTISLKSPNLAAAPDEMSSAGQKWPQIKANGHHAIYIHVDIRICIGYLYVCTDCTYVCIQIIYFIIPITTYMYVYIYIYMYVSIILHLYIYIYMIYVYTYVYLYI